jgi:peptidylprolyl isomerase
LVNSKHDAPRLARLGLMLALMAWSPALALTEQPKDAVAQLGATRLSPADFSDFLHAMDPQTRSQAQADPQVMTRLIQLEVIRKAILREAVAKNWQQKPDVAKQVAVARDAIVLKSYLGSVAEMPANYPSEQDIKSSYDLNRDKFLVPRQYHLAQIFISSPAGDRNAAAALQKAKALAAQARGGKIRFEDLARQNSQHRPSAEKGGDIGWLFDSQIMPEIRGKAAGMRSGEVSDPIRGDQGWHIVRLIDTKPAGLKPLAEVRPLIAASLRQQRQQEQEQQYIVRLLQKTPVTVNQAQVRKALEAAR